MALFNPCMKKKMLLTIQNQIQAVCGACKVPKLFNLTNSIVTLKIDAMEQTAVDEMRSRIFRKLLKYFLPFPCSSFQKAFGSDRLLYDDKNKLNKNFLKEVFSLHYNQPDLKVSYYYTT